MSTAPSKTARVDRSDPELTEQLGGWVVACPDCQLSGGPFPRDAEARFLADRHDGIHHRGRPTAEATDRFVCESCRTRAAIATWTTSTAAGSAGVPFAVCERCACDSTPDPGQETSLT
jgi:hypothetical protein